uniref:Protein Wnt n=1 Tax=Megaselia scalaris TaxID=36166 RepID=T1H205_MEGSC
MIVRNSIVMKCKCHGLSGSCTLKTCWKKLPSFKLVGNKLMKRYQNATKVIASNDGTSLIPENLLVKNPSKFEIVFGETSEDFCEPNSIYGSLGIIGRECNISSKNEENCDWFCCNRGYRKVIIEVKNNCNCNFEWCCQVKCKTCIEQKEIFICT